MLIFCLFTVIAYLIVVPWKDVDRGNEDVVVADR